MEERIFWVLVVVCLCFLFVGFLLGRDRCKKIVRKSIDGDSKNHVNTKFYHFKKKYWDMVDNLIGCRDISSQPNLILRLNRPKLGFYSYCNGEDLSSVKTFIEDTFEKLLEIVDEEDGRFLLLKDLDELFSEFIIEAKKDIQLEFPVSRYVSLRSKIETMEEVIDRLNKKIADIKIREVSFGGKFPEIIISDEICPDDKDPFVSAV